jgi:hypothetical protein
MVCVACVDQCCIEIGLWIEPSTPYVGTRLCSCHHFYMTPDRRVHRRMTFCKTRLCQVLAVTVPALLAAPVPCLHSMAQCHTLCSVLSFTSVELRVAF